MPIRMTDDPQEQNQNDYNDDEGGDGNRRGGGGGGLFSFLPLAFVSNKSKSITR